MKKPVVDYRAFRFSRLGEPEFSHLKLLGGWIVYFVLYFVTENLISAEKCHVIHCGLDDLIPFCEYFAIFYILWYVFVFGWLLYYLLYDIPQFKKLQIYIMLTQAIAMAIYILYPNRQDLRPDVFQHNNVFTHIMAFIYAFDTNTGVLPSLHVGYSIAIASTTWKNRSLPAGIKLLNLFFTVMVAISVCFVKQHSVLDVLAAVIMCIVIEIALYCSKIYTKHSMKVKRSS